MTLERPKNQPVEPPKPDSTGFVILLVLAVIIGGAVMVVIGWLRSAIAV